MMQVLGFILSFFFKVQVEWLRFLSLAWKKCSYHFLPFLPQLYSLLDTSAFAGLGQVQKQKQLHKKICPCVATVWRRIHPDKPCSKRCSLVSSPLARSTEISKFPHFFAQQSPKCPNLWLLSKLLVFPQHPSRQK